MFSNLINVSKTHVNSWGMFLVSLMATPASHVLATVMEIRKTVCIQKALQAEHDLLGSSASFPALPNSGNANGFSHLCVL